MRRALLSAAALTVVLLAGCSASGAPGDPEATPTPTMSPTWVDLEAAAQLGGQGNGLWLLDGPTAAGRIIDAARVGEAAMTLDVQEMVVVEGEDPVAGRSIRVERAGTTDRYRADFAVGDLVGDVVVIGPAVWMRGNAALTERFGLSGDAYACVSRQSAAFADLEELLNPADVVRASLIGMELGVLPPAPDADTLAVVIGTGGAPVGQLIVDASGSPLPRSLVSSDPTGTVSATFVWGPGDDVAVPDGAAAACG